MMLMRKEKDRREKGKGKGRWIIVKRLKKRRKNMWLKKERRILSCDWKRIFLFNFFNWVMY